MYQASSTPDSFSTKFVLNLFYCASLILIFMNIFSHRRVVNDERNRSRMFYVVNKQSMLQKITNQERT